MGLPTTSRVDGAVRSSHGLRPRPQRQPGRRENAASRGRWAAAGLPVGTTFYGNSPCGYVIPQGPFKWKNRIRAARVIFIVPTPEGRSAERPGGIPPARGGAPVKPAGSFWKLPARCAPFPPDPLRLRLEASRPPVRTLRGALGKRSARSSPEGRWKLRRPAGSFRGRRPHPRLDAAAQGIQTRPPAFQGDEAGLHRKR